MAQPITKGDVLQRLASIGFVGGGVLTLVFNAIYPRASDPSDIPEVLTRLADNELLSQLAFLGIAVGLWAIVVGFVGVYRSISAGAEAAWARLGFYAVLVATATWSVSMAVGVAGATAAADWVGAGSGTETVAYGIAASLYAVGFSVENLTVVGYWLALTFVAIGMVLGDVYPKWLGWAPLVLGVVTAVIGGVRLFADPNQTLELVFAVPAGLTSVWAIVIGAWIARKAW